MKHNGRGVRFEKLSPVKYRLITINDWIYNIDGEITIEKYAHKDQAGIENYSWHVHEQLDKGSAESISKGFRTLAEAKQLALRWEKENRGYFVSKKAQNVVCETGRGRC